MLAVPRTTRTLAAAILLLAPLACSDSASDAYQSIGGDEQTLASPSSPTSAATEDGPPLGLSSDSLITIGLSHYDQGEYEAARTYLAEAVARAQGEGGTPARARALTWLGLAAWRQGDFPSARRLGEEALSIKLEAGLDDQLFRSYNALGLLAWYESRLADAIRLYELAREAAEAVGDEEGAGKAANNIGLILVEFGDFAGAREGFERMLRAGRALGDFVTEAKALTNLGMLDVLVGSPRRAIPRLEEAIRLYRQAGYPTGEENALAQLATAYRELGEPGRAHAMLDSAIALAQAQGLRPEEAADVEVLAELYRAAGDHRRALELYAQAAEINQEVGLSLEAGADLRNQALIFAELGDLEAAGVAAGEALRLDREVGSRFEELLDHLALAEIAYLQGRPGDVARHLRDSHALVRALDSRTARVELALSEGRIADAGLDAPAALMALAGAAEDLSMGDFATEWEAASLRARAYLRLGQLDSAAVAGEWAVTLIERVRGRFSSGPLRTAYAASRIETYADLVEILLRAGRYEDALSIADAARGSGLYAQLAVSSQDLGPGAAGTATATSAARGEVLLRQIDLLVAATDSLEALEPDERDAATAEELRARLGRARREYESHLVRVAEASPEKAALLGGRRVSATDIRAALAPGEVLLEYLVTPERLVIFAVTSDDVRTAESPITAENLASRVRLAAGLVKNPTGTSASVDVLGSLYELLIEPAVRTAPVSYADRLIVVPHGVLSYVPFAALRDRSSGRYVAEDHAVVHLPSASSLVALRNKGRDSQSLEPAESAHAFAPFPDRFPATLTEARAIAREVGGVTVTIGDEATEPRVRQALAVDGFVHLASHGVMNAQSPMFSRIELARGENGDSAEDGRLEVHEVLDLTIRSPLVFLSGCETGLGAAWSTGFDQGEDYATLDRAFLLAGADAVIATLWRVEDEGAAAFASRFYKELRGARAPEAVASAQRAMIGDRRYASPFYWAAYRLSGGL